MWREKERDSMCMRVCLSILFLNSLLSIKPIISEVKVYVLY